MAQMLGVYRTGPSATHDDAGLADILRKLVAQHGLPAALQTLAHIMADIGSVTGGVVSEAASIEQWLAQRGPTEVGNEHLSSDT
jgi:hypothetical protein